MAVHANRFIDLAENNQVATLIAKMWYQKELLKTSKNIEDGVKHLADLRKAENALVVAFLAAYQPTVLGSTVDLMSHSPQFASGFNHLILDEAAQMSTISAFAVYATLRDINRITLIGDSLQLEPYSELIRGSPADMLYRKGELTRLEELNHPPMHTKLHTIYRCHPKLVKMWLKPIYGTEIIAGGKEEHRNLASKCGLPVAKDNTPSLLVQVKGSNDKDGANLEEIAACLKLLNKIKKSDNLSEVAIVCHHRVQKGCLIEKLQGTGDLGPHKLPCIITTVDSFQGKEARIVIVLTTKVCGSNNYDTVTWTLDFISGANRGTVAVSRSTDAMYLFGDWSKIMYTKFWSQFIEKIVESGALVCENLEELDAEHFFRKQSQMR